MKIGVWRRDMVGFKIIGKQIYGNIFSFTKFRKVRNISDKEEWTENGALWHSTRYVFLAGKCVIDFYAKFSVV